MFIKTYRIWFSVLVLCIAAFTMVSSEFAPIGLLSLISTDLGQDPGAVGLTVMLYAWIGAASGLLSGWINRWILPRTLLTILLIILAVSNCLTALCYELSALVGARALGAVAHGVFWAMVAATAAQIVPQRQIGLATSIVMGGITIATVMGVPVVNLVGQYSGWRTAFLGLSLLSLFSAVLVRLVLPRVSIRSVGELGLLSVFLNRRDLRLIYGLTALTAGAHFSAYTFIEPFIARIPEINPPIMASLLFSFGLMGFAGNFISAIFIDRRLQPLILFGLSSLALSLIGLGVYGPSANFFLIVALLLLWGVAISTLFTGLQAWVLRTAGDQMIPAAAIHTAVLNIAIGLGIVCNSLVIAVVDLETAMLVGGIIVAPAILLMCNIWINSASMARSETES